MLGELTVIFFGEEIAVHPNPLVKEYVKVVEGPEYGLATLKLPPVGLPDSKIGTPTHPFALDAVTIGNGLIVIAILFDVAVLGEAQVAVEVTTQVMT